MNLFSESEICVRKNSRVFDGCKPSGLVIVIDKQNVSRKNGHRRGWRSSTTGAQRIKTYCIDTGTLTSAKPATRRKARRSAGSGGSSRLKPAWQCVYFSIDKLENCTTPNLLESRRAMRSSPICYVEIRYLLMKMEKNSSSEPSRANRLVQRNSVRFGRPAFLGGRRAVRKPFCTFPKNWPPYS